jgi:DNA-binding MarR family transcriptional regulator
MTADQRALDRAEFDARRQAEIDARRLRLFHAALDADLPTNTKMVLLALVRCARGSRATPLARHLMKISGLSRAAVFKALADLENGGHITRERKPGKRTTYRNHPTSPSGGPVQQVDPSTT